MATLTPKKPASDRQAARRSPGKWIALGAFLLVLLIAVPVVLLVTGDDDNGTSPTTTPDTTPPTTAPVTIPAEFTLFFLADYIQDSNRPGPHLMPVGRSVDITVNPTLEDEIRSAVLALTGGVAAEDSAAIAGLSTSIPAGTELLGVTVDAAGGTVSLNFNDEFASGGGTFSVTSRLAQVVFTATAFEGIDGVIFEIDGRPVDVFSSEGLILEGAQTRADYEDFLPLMMIDAPLAGEEIMSPVTITGLANAFEATVSLRIETIDGDLIAEDFTTATCGTGCFGEFAATLWFAIEDDTAARIVALEYSAEDGSPLNVFAIPVMLMPGGEPPPIDGEPRSYDIEVSALPAQPIEGMVVVQANWGEGPGEVGLFTAKRFGPCCFDVSGFQASGRQQIVLVDSQNSRLIVFENGEEPQTLMDFDPSDFIPESVAIIGDRVITVGLTNRPERPYDAIALRLADGELIKRVETSVDTNGDLRATTDGVFWARASSNPHWLAIADSEGNLLEASQQRSFAFLPGESTLNVYYDAGVEVNVQPAGDSRLSTFDVIDDNARFIEVLGYSGFADGALVVLGSEFDESSRSNLTLLKLGTDLEDNLVAVAYSLGTERWAEVGSFNTFRYAAGGFYVLNTTPDGVQIVRIELN